MTALLLVAAGIGGLIVGAELLIRGSLRVAAAFGVSQLVIGLTLVAFGTSSPELAVTVVATIRQQGDIALGNVIGSNILNILLVLGGAAVLMPVAIGRDILRLHLPIMVGVSVLAWLLASDGVVSRFEGFLLIAGIAVFTLGTIQHGRKTGAAEPPEEASVSAGSGSPARGPTALHILTNIGLSFAGLVCLVMGSRWMVAGASDVARLLGASELAIGLTIVAVGTSLPEVATSILAAARGRSDIAVGNVVGSNIFNILAILGAAAAIAPAGLRVAAPALALDLPVMIAIALLCVPVFVSGQRVARSEGALFLACYIGYIALLAGRA